LIKSDKCQNNIAIPASVAYFNPLALELDIHILVHHLRTMWIFYEPRRVTLGNTATFCGRINEGGEGKSKK